MFVNVIHRCNLIHVSPLNCELLHMRACILGSRETDAYILTYLTTTCCMSGVKRRILIWICAVIDEARGEQVQD